MDKTWENFQTHLTDAQQNMWRRQKQTEKQMGFHGAYAVLMFELGGSNYALINMAQTEIMDKEKITTLTRMLAEFTKRFGVMKTKLDRILSGQTGGAASASTSIPNKYVMVPTYWKADDKHIWYKKGLLMGPWLLREAIT